MITRTLACSIALIAGLLAGSGAELTFQFSTNNAPLFDFSNTWETNEDGAHEVFTMVLSPRGRISGTYTASGEEDGVQINMDGQLSGSIVATYPSDIRMVLNMRGDFVATQGAMQIQGRHSLHGVFRQAEGSDVVVGRMNGTICARGRCFNIHQNREFPLTDGSSGSMEEDGTWTLSLNLEPVGRRVTGTATATLANERSVAFTVRGVVSSKGITTLQLRGSGDAAGTLLQVRLNAAQEIIILRGRLFGQQLGWSAAAL